MECDPEFDLAIRCGYFLSMKDGAASVKRNQLLGIRGHTITAIRNWPTGHVRALRVIDAYDKIVMPGLINGHSHLAMTLFRGLADDLPLAEWLHNYILPLEAKLVNPEFVRLGSELAALELLLSGTTTVADMFYFAGDTADVLNRVGMRAVVGEGISDFRPPDDREGKGGNYRILDELCERYQTHGRITPSIAPHAPYTCSDATLRKASDYAYRKSIPLQIHVAETAGEVANSLKEFGKTPVKRIADLGLLERPCILAHCVHLQEGDFSHLCCPTCGVVHNPESNMKLGSGVAPVREMRRRGVKVGLGTDGAASNNDLSLFREMDNAAKLQKLSCGDPTALTAAEALAMATIDGARALGQADQIGSLEVGKFADCLIVGTDFAHMRPLHNVASQLVYAATGGEVETVICHGEVVVDGRVAKHIDAANLFRRVEDYRGRFMPQLG